MAEGMLAHDYYQRAARGAVECYLALLANPKEQTDGNEPDYSGLTAAQKKREKVRDTSGKLRMSLFHSYSCGGELV
jgi:hypothetical protein